MTELMKINSEQTMSSREIAELTGKSHQHVLRDIDKLNSNYDNLHLPRCGQMFSIRQLPNGGAVKDRYFDLTRIQTFDLMTGYDTKLRIKVNRRWEELEKKQNTIDLSDANTILLLAQNYKEEQDRRMLAEAKIKEDAPKVLFADAVTTSGKSILVGELAKILRQNGVNMGQNRLFSWMRNKGFLMKSGERYNQPSQRAMELELYEIKKTSITKPDGSVLVSTTTKVTPKGQIYFVSKFVKQEELELA